MNGQTMEENMKEWRLINEWKSEYSNEEKIRHIIKTATLILSFINQQPEL